MKQELVLVCGLPGSGKSTMAQRIAKEEGYFHIEADMFFEDAWGNYCFDSAKLSAAHTFCQQVTSIMLRRGVNVVVANTFLTEDEIAPYIHIAYANKVRVRLIECDGDYGSIHNVPENVIQKMKERYTRLDPLKLEAV